MKVGNRSVYSAFLQTFSGVLFSFSILFKRDVITFLISLGSVLMSLPAKSSISKVPGVVFSFLVQVKSA